MKSGEGGAATEVLLT